jgi:hypothetical protein
VSTFGQTDGKGNMTHEGASWSLGHSSSELYEAMPGSGTTRGGTRGSLPHHKALRVLKADGEVATMEIDRHTPLGSGC